MQNNVSPLDLYHYEFRTQHGLVTGFAREWPGVVVEADCLQSCLEHLKRALAIAVDFAQRNAMDLPIPIGEREQRALLVAGFTNEERNIVLNAAQQSGIAPSEFVREASLSAAKDRIPNYVQQAWNEASSALAARERSVQDDLKNKQPKI